MKIIIKDSNGYCSLQLAKFPLVVECKENPFSSQSMLVKSADLLKYGVSMPGLDFYPFVLSDMCEVIL